MVVTGGGGGCDAAGAARVCGAPVAERPVGGHCSKRLQGRFDYTIPTRFGNAAFVYGDCDDDRPRTNT
jgi:hypothetical protein